jgi:hypothetical protein
MHVKPCDSWQLETCTVVDKAKSLAGSDKRRGSHDDKCRRSCSDTPCFQKPHQCHAPPVHHSNRKTLSLARGRAQEGGLFATLGAGQGCGWYRWRSRTLEKRFGIRMGPAGLRIIAPHWQPMTRAMTAINRKPSGGRQLHMRLCEMGETCRHFSPMDRVFPSAALDVKPEIANSSPNSSPAFMTPSVASAHIPHIQHIQRASASPAGDMSFSSSNVGRLV